ncbi:MAG: DUF4011 domain-containing protein [Bernardetiaceae bacterium]|nr:DUF4011 domain-containing protein [Bernardetiaceae bacterium]
MSKILKTYQKRLTNLTAANRSLLLRRLYKQFFMDLRSLDFAENQSAFSILAQLIGRKKEIAICPYIDSRDANANRQSAQLKNIFRSQKRIEEESGTIDLAVGYPFVEGKFLNDTMLRAPLLFFPVSLYHKQNTWFLRLRKEAGISFNKSLLLAFSHYHDIIFEEDFLEETFENFGKTSLEFLTELYKLIDKSPLELDFNRENFNEKLDFFHDKTKKELEDSLQVGKLKLLPQAVLGIFPQSDSYLAPDYEKLIGDSTQDDLETFFLKKNNTEATQGFSEDNFFAPFVLDASQEQAIREVRSGKSILVQGPPGTGKSHLICNLIGDYIARGKKVLVVCQKKVALDVVYKRLAAEGMGRFMGLVHDFRQDRAHIYQEIAQQIEELDAYRKENNSLDAIQIERQFQQLSREITQICEHLESFKKALFDERECGIAVKELYLTAQPEQPFIDLKNFYKAFNFNTYHDFVQKFESFVAYAKRLETEGYVWKERVSFADFQYADLHHIKEVFEEIPVFKQDFTEKLRLLLADTSLSFEDAVNLQTHKKDMQRLVALLAEEGVFEIFKACLPHQTESEWLTNKQQIINECFERGGIEQTIPQRDLPLIQDYLDEYHKAQSKTFNKLKWRLLARKKDSFIKEILHKNQLPDNQKGIAILMKRIDNRMNLEHNISMLTEAEWLNQIPQIITAEELDTQFDENPLSIQATRQDFNEWFELQKKALQAKALLEHLGKSIYHIVAEMQNFDQVQHFFTRLSDTMELLPQRKIRWTQYLVPKQIERILAGSHHADKMWNVLEKDFDWLIEFDKLKASMPQEQLATIDLIRAHSGSLKVRESLLLFENSLRNAWIAHIEAKYPILRAVSSPKMEQLTKRLQEAIQEKNQISADIMRLKAREQTYKNTKTNRLGNRISYREIAHQVKKKRIIWALRRLINAHSDELFDLMPCWLCSPESASAIFPMRQLFDLVIFDEASQCFAEKGIPAIYRGRQLLIAGDEKQLAPGDLYRPRWEDKDLEEQDLAAELEVDSLLDLAKQFLPQFELRGHYRSRLPELIDFSNQHFYNGKLEVLPDYEEYIKQKPAIQYFKTDGIWHQNQNETEAREIVRMVRDLVQSGKEDIGIITFNYKQQNLIEDLLDLLEIPLPPTVFVKNIENVQGDERDIIIFSVAYAPNAAGKMYARFGSLNLQGGENRLNVAVTRAREQIIVVSSVYPHQLNISDEHNKGAQLLKSYLEYALAVSEGKYRSSLSGKASRRSSWYLKEKILTLTAADKWKSDLPFADLYSQSIPITLLLTDDEAYFAESNPKALHAYQPLRLKACKWEFQRVYSRNYWIDREDFLAGVRQVGKLT